MLPSSQLREVTIKDYIVVLKRRIWVVISCLLIFTLLFAIKTFKEIPLYQTAAKILIEKNNPHVLPMEQVYTPYWVDREYIQSQINVLTSRILAKKTVESITASGDNSFVGIPDPDTVFLEDVSVSQQLGTQIINVGYISPDPIKAARYANALTNAYIQQDVDNRTGAAKTATQWLQKELEGARKKLQDCELALNKYIQQNKIVAVADIDKKTNAISEGLKQDKINAENEIKELSKRYKEKHPKMIALNTRLGAINSSIEEETKKLLSLNEQMIEYDALKREVESSKSLYESLLKRTKETEVSKELETTNIHIVDLADVPREPFKPKRLRDILFGLILGVLSGVGLAFFLEHLDSTIKTAQDVEMYVRLPFLGYVPIINKADVKTDKEMDLIVNAQPKSHASEAYRSIRTSIIFSAPEDKPLKTILVTSTSIQEGKSSVAMSLGIIFANANERVLLVDADMRRPRLARSLGLDNKEGLSSFLAGASSLDAAIKKTNIPGLSLLSSGPIPPNPAELLASAKIRALLEELEKRFDRVIVDSPPLLSVADTTILANIADGVIDVIRAGSLNIELIVRGIKRLNEAKAKIIGVVLNNVDVKKEDSYYYYHYHYVEEKKKQG
jgi:succinoglycan biosynthesis transport protein ExoP